MCEKVHGGNKVGGKLNSRHLCRISSKNCHAQREVLTKVPLQNCERENANNNVNVGISTSSKSKNNV